MKKLFKLLLFCFIIIGTIGCSGSSKPDGMSDETYKIGLEVLKTTDNYLDGKIDEKEAINSISIITDDFISSDEHNDAMVSSNIKLITMSLDSNYGSVYTKVEKARNSLAETLGEKEYSSK